MSKFLKILFVATSIAPILLTYWFIEQVNAWDSELSTQLNLINNYAVGINFIFATATLLVIYFAIIFFSKSYLEPLSIKIEEIKTADNESLTFVIVYLLPIASGINESLSVPIIIFIAIIFSLIILTTNSYHFNPLLNLFGYHFYEVKIEGGVNYVLLSKKNIRNSKSITDVFHLTEYMILEKNNTL